MRYALGKEVIILDATCDAIYDLTDAKAVEETMVVSEKAYFTFKTFWEGLEEVN